MDNLAPAILWMIPAAPLLAAAIIGLFGPRWLRALSHWPCLAALGLSTFLSIYVLLALRTGGAEKALDRDAAQLLADLEQEKKEAQEFGRAWPAGKEQELTLARRLAGEAAATDRDYALVTVWPWIQVGDLRVEVGLRADALTAIMLCMVTLVSTLVAVYAVGYMHSDPGYPRFFAEISLFVFSMTMLVLANNFLLLYVFWEAVGLCSYLLIGFWFRRPAAAAAARKAFLVNRIGDFGFAIGIFLLWNLCGLIVDWRPQGGQLLDYQVVFGLAERIDAAHPGLLLGVCLLLFVGAVGKSAQFPLHVWLPDAMEGPTPVSALIHAATMVTAGVYLVARCTPLFALAPEAQVMVSGIGAATALMAAVIAVTQNDLKRVLAYSTVSQLGLMFMALGSAAANPELTGFAVAAGMFHLFTHAFFKALLFLGAGSVMHAMGDVIDMRRFGGLRRVLKHTHWTFLVGALALAGVFPLAGFWSKDEILASVHSAGRHGPHAWFYFILFVVGVAVTLLTAFYIFRAYFLTFWGEERLPPEAHGHAHESPPVMLWPLFILAVKAMTVGVLLGPTAIFMDYLHRTPGIPTVHSHEFNWVAMTASLLSAAGGIALAWWIYVKQPGLPRRLRQGLAGLYELSYRKLFIDELYAALIVTPLRGFAVFCRVLDQYLVDGLVDLVGSVPAMLGRVFRPVQNGLVQFYALAMVMGLAVFVVAMVWRLLV